MNINRPDETLVGFISVLSGTVKNVKFKDCYVSAKPAIGIIVGEGKDDIARLPKGVYVVNGKKVIK